MTPSDDERYLESRLAEMNRRLDPDQGAAEDDDLPVFGKPCLRRPCRGQIADGKDPFTGRTREDAGQIRVSAVGEDQTVVGKRLAIIEQQATALAIQCFYPDTGPYRQERISLPAGKEEFFLGERPDHELRQERPVITAFLFCVDQSDGPLRPYAPAGRWRPENLPRRRRQLYNPYHCSL